MFEDVLIRITILKEWFVGLSVSKEVTPVFIEDVYVTCWLFAVVTFYCYGVWFCVIKLTAIASKMSFIDRNVRPI